MELVERYNKLLQTTEKTSIDKLNSVLDSSFNRLVRRARVQMRLGSADPALRNLALLQEFRQLVPVFNPARVDAYDRLFQRLVVQAQTNGLAVADELTGKVKTGSRVDVSIPLEATVAAAAQAKGYLRKHGERFATTSAEVVAQGIAEGRPTDAMVRDMRSRLGVVKSRAEAIVRTESLRAYNSASNQYYAANGIDLCMWYATSDDRSCPICNARAGRIYKRAEIKAPCHPRCRCYLAPWDPEIAAMDPEYTALPRRHREEVSKVATVGPADLNKAAVFEQFAPQPFD